MYQDQWGAPVQTDMPNPVERWERDHHSWQEPLPTRLVGEVPNNTVKKSSVPSECGGQRSDVTKPTDQISCQRIWKRCCLGACWMPLDPLLQALLALTSPVWWTVLLSYVLKWTLLPWVACVRMLITTTEKETQTGPTLKPGLNQEGSLSVAALVHCTIFTEHAPSCSVPVCVTSFTAHQFRTKRCGSWIAVSQGQGEVFAQYTAIRGLPALANIKLIQLQVNS